jgi:hypothetical protein
MATTQALIEISLKAAADLSTKQFYFVEATAADTVNACNAITDLAIGVLTNKPSAAGQAASVAIGGIAKVVAGAAISAGAKVAPMASGKAQTAASTQFPRGVALEAAGADGDIIHILLLTSGAALP